jgi:hypothetical protein
MYLYSLQIKGDSQKKKKNMLEETVGNYLWTYKYGWFVIASWQPGKAFKNISSSSYCWTYQHILDMSVVYIKASALSLLLSSFFFLYNSVRI